MNRLIKFTLNYQFILVLFCLFCFSCLVVLTPRIQTNDDIGYYSLTRSVIIDGDLDLRQELQHYKNQGYLFKSLKKDPVTGIVYSQYPIGVSFLQAPFLAVAHGIALLFGYAPNGYSQPYLFMTSLGSTLYGFIGLLIILWIAGSFFNRPAARLSTLGIWFCSAYYYYMFLQPTISHIYSLFIISLFIYTWLKTLKQGGIFQLEQAKERSFSQHFLLGAIGGIAVLVRYQDGVFLSVLVMEYLYFSWEYIQTEQISKAIRLFSRYLVSFSGFLLVLLPQALLLVYQHHGLAVLEHYGGDFYFSLTLITIPKILFGQNHGLFYWHPFLLAGLIGLIVCLFSSHRVTRFMAVTAIVVFSLITVVTASWGNNAFGAQSFGHRFYVSFYPYFAWGAGRLLHPVFQKKNRFVWIVCLIIAGFAAWNFGLMIQYGARMIATDGAVSFSEMARNMFFRLPGELSDIIHRFLFDRDSFF